MNALRQRRLKLLTEKIRRQHFALKLNTTANDSSFLLSSTCIVLPRYFIERRRSCLLSKVTDTRELLPALLSLTVSLA